MIPKQIKNTGIPEEGDVLLVVSPMTTTTLPVMGLHLLQAACQQAGITVSVFYSNLSYANMMGPELHGKIARDYSIFISEALFSTTAFGLPVFNRSPDKFSIPGWMPDHLWPSQHNIDKQTVPGTTAPYREWFNAVDWKHLESLIAGWTVSIARQLANLGYRVVGCSTTFGGLVPAVALLNHIKKANPAVVTILGGTLCEEVMAEGILSLKSGIDYVFSGEGEITFPAFIGKVLTGDLPEEKIIYGEEVTHLDTNPLPDYQDYFHQIEMWDPHPSSPNCFCEIPYETSRGCWYGKCTFCSLNGKKNIYRQKSPNKIINDLKVLIDKYPVNTVFLSDNIMPIQYFDTLLPRIWGEISSINIRCELKANLTLNQVIDLKKAGFISIEPGIESLSPPMLRRMRKGVTVRENIALLRYARSVNLKVIWHILFGIPGDQASDYEKMLSALPLIRHLPPPVDMFSLKICRFSKYHTSPQMFDMWNLRPAEVYNDILPAHAQLEKIAYYFTADFPAQSHENPEMITALWKEYRAWCKAWAAYELIPLEVMLPTLHITRKSHNQYILQDTRGLPGKPERMVFDREQASILLLARPQDSTIDYQWAIDAGLGITIDSWFIPLATAEPGLLLEFERDFKPVS